MCRTGGRAPSLAAQGVPGDSLMQSSHSVSHAEAHIWNPSGLPDWLARRLPVESQPPAPGPDGVILRAPPTAPSLSLSLSYSSSPEKWSSAVCLLVWGATGRDGGLGI